jgi:antitoxin VapB
MKRAKLFKNGGSQAVRLPKEFRIEGDEVLIRKEGEAVVLEPVKKPSWPKGFFKRIRIEDPKFERPDQGATLPSPSI